MVNPDGNRWHLSGFIVELLEVLLLQGVHVRYERFYRSGAHQWIDMIMESKPSRVLAHPILRDGAVHVDPSLQAA